MDYHSRAPFLAIVFFVLFFYSCSEKKPLQVTRSYYYWRSDGDITAAEIKFLKAHHIKKLYVKLMDIDWSEVYGAIPVSGGQPDQLNSRLNEYDSVKTGIIPVVFITNKTFEKITSAEIPVLAKRIVRRCLLSYDDEDKRYEREHYSWGKRFQPAEIQFDCDWTISTKDKYFSFLREVERLVSAHRILLSATIRLHQYKYPDKTGVPPVNRGMLMVYNISDLRSYSPVNSIYDDSRASPYFASSKKYSLPLDIVLPAYSWCIIFRDQKFYQIENGLSEKDLQGLSFLQKTNNNFYKVRNDTVFHDLFLRPGDEIRAEGISREALLQAAQLAGRAINSDSVTISFFELSEKEISNYDYETIENVYNSYR